MAELTGNLSRDSAITIRSMTRFLGFSLTKGLSAPSLVAAMCLFCGGAVQAADFTVTSPGFFFSFNGTGSNPTITLMRGRTYTFALNTSPGFHPFGIGTSVFGPAPAGVSGVNGGSSGTITFVVPLNASDCVYYCTLHGFGGNILMINPPAPPRIEIVGLTVGTNLTLKATLEATNGLTLVPEFSTNLLTTNWFALAVQTNRFANGTNEAICGKPPGVQVFVRVRAQQN